MYQCIDNDDDNRTFGNNKNASTEINRDRAIRRRKKKVMYNLSGIRTDRIARSCEENNKALDTSYRFDTKGHGSSLYSNSNNINKNNNISVARVSKKQRDKRDEESAPLHTDNLGPGENMSRTSLDGERSSIGTSNSFSILNNSNRYFVDVEGIPYDTRVIENRLSESYERLPRKMESKKESRDERFNEPQRPVTTAPGRHPNKSSHMARMVQHYTGNTIVKQNSHRPATVMSTSDIYKDQKDISKTIVGRVYSGAWNESNFHCKDAFVIGKSSYDTDFEKIRQKCAKSSYETFGRKILGLDSDASSYPWIGHMSSEQQYSKSRNNNIALDENGGDTATIDMPFQQASRHPPSRRDVILLRRKMLEQMNAAASKDHGEADEGLDDMDLLSYSLLDVLNDTMLSLVQQVGIHCQERGQLLHEVWNMSMDVVDSVIENRDKHIDVLNSQVMELTLELENAMSKFDESQVGKIDAMNKVLLEQNDELKLNCATIETKSHQLEKQLQQIKMKGLMTDTMREIVKDKNTTLEGNVRLLEKEVRQVENRMNAAMSSLESELQLEKELRQNAEKRAGPELPDDIRGEMHKEITTKLNNAMTWLDTVRSFKVIERVKDMPSRELVNLIERGELPETVEERLGLDILQLDNTNSNNEVIEGSWMTSSRSRRRSSINSLVNNNKKVFDRYLNQLRQRMDMKNAELDYLRVRVEKQQEKLSNRKKTKEQNAANNYNSVSTPTKGDRSMMMSRSIELGTSRQGEDSSSSMLSTQRVSRFLDSYGTSNQVPKFLRNSNNKVRNRALTRLNAEQLVIQILLERQQIAGKQDGSIDYTNSNSIRLSEYVYNFLRQRYGVLSMIHEWGYSLIDACHRFIGESGLLFLFKQMTFNQISENNR